MKALKITGYGKLSKNLQFQECEMPELHDNDVMIEVYAASINPIDFKTVKGSARILQNLNFPAPIGYDVSGVVSAKGKQVSEFNVGDEVFARVESARPGTLAEFIAADASLIAFKPKNITFEEAASIPLVGLTTMQAFKIAKVNSDSKVLIHAGSGGIGTFAVQYAKAIGAEVYTTTSTGNVEWVKKLSPDKVIDYKKQNYLEEITEVDFVYDTLGGIYTADAFKVLKKGGFVINLTGPVLDKQAVNELGISSFLKPIFALLRMKINRLKKQKNAHYHFMLMEPNGEQLNEIGRLLSEGKIIPVIDSVFPFDKAIEALEKLASSRAKGKIVVKVK